MEIVKKLSLNKTPKDLVNGSIVCAKNMMVDDTGSFLTTDTGFDLVELGLRDGEYIVGVIPCNKEIVVFTNFNRILRKEDNDDEPVKEVHTNWKWSKGKITGTFTYNYKDELVLAVAESESTDNIDVPLKSFIIHAGTPPVEDMNEGEVPSDYAYYARANQTYATEEIVPNVTCQYNISKSGSLVCGVYTFFIRYKVDTDNYTKWFQITPDINIIKTKRTKTYLHKYLNASNVEQEQVEGDAVVNAEGISDKGITLDINVLNNESSFNEVQIGYIIKVGGDVQCRVQGSYDISDETIKVKITNNTYISSEPLELFLESPRALYNVSTLCNYNNRTYLAGYKEYNNTDYSQTAKNIVVTGKDSVPGYGPTPSPPQNLKNITLQITQYCKYHYNAIDSSVKYKTIDLIQLRDIEVNPTTGKILDTSDFFSKLAPYLWLKDPNFSEMFYLNGDVKSSATGAFKYTLTNGNLYLMIQPTNLSDAICVYSYLSTGITPSSNWLWYDKLTIDPNLELYLKTGTDGKTIIKATIGTNDYILFDNSNITNIGILGYIENYPLDNVNMYYCGSCKGTTDIVAPYFPHNKLDKYIITNSILPYIRDNEEETEDSDDGIYIADGDVNVNTRTLIPNQLYNFFIHYIRKDGSCTPGYHIASKYFTSSEGQLYVPVFSKVDNPTPSTNEFVGWFISYESIERNVDCLYVTDVSQTEQSMTSAEYLYDLDTPRGNKIILGSTTQDNIANELTYKENRLLHNHIKIKPALNDQANCLAFLLRDFVPYRNKEKVLYRLTKNIYHWGEVCDDKDYLPDYLNHQLLITYKGNSGGQEGLIIDPAIPYVLGFDIDGTTESGEKVTYNVNIKEPVVYSKYPTEAMNIKQDYIQTAVVLSSVTSEIEDTSENKKIATKRDDLAINCLVTPDRLHDYLELQPAYQAKPSKAYINYREDNISQFNKTVYRSDVCSDESLVNGFRHFNANDYKNILENKGKITNIVGIGLYLIIHTEYSLFVFDRSPKLTQRNQLDIPDAFDIDYQEVMPANEGYGGLADKDESIITKHGYIWFDRTSKYIFRYDEGKVNIISGDINNFIKYIEPTTVKFAEDTIHNRLMICIYYSGGDKFVTLSYNFITNTYISLHDYKFTNNYKTYNKSYVFDNTEENKGRLYEFNDKHNCEYDTLEAIQNQNNFFDCITRPTSDDEGEYEIRPYVDIICNEQPNVNKQLDAISYVLERIKGSGYSFDIVRPTEEDLHRRYSGRELRIYTDETDTTELDIDIRDTDEHAVRRENRRTYSETWKYPVFDKGKWLLNYFRNYINDTDKKSDEKALIYGKYIVARFIFNKEDRVKLESITFKVNPY